MPHWLLASSEQLLHHLIQSGNSLLHWGLPEILGMWWRSVWSAALPSLPGCDILEYWSETSAARWILRSMRWNGVTLTGTCLQILKLQWLPLTSLPHNLSEHVSNLSYPTLWSSSSCHSNHWLEHRRKGGGGKGNDLPSHVMSMGSTWIHHHRPLSHPATFH